MPEVRGIPGGCCYCAVRRLHADRRVGRRFPSPRRGDHRRRRRARRVAARARARVRHGSRRPESSRIPASRSVAVHAVANVARQTAAANQGPELRPVCGNKRGREHPACHHRNDVTGPEPGPESVSSLDEGTVRAMRYQNCPNAHAAGSGKYPVRCDVDALRQADLRWSPQSEHTTREAAPDVRHAAAPADSRPALMTENDHYAYVGSAGHFCGFQACQRRCLMNGSSVSSRTFSKSAA